VRAVCERVVGQAERFIHPARQPERSLRLSGASAQRCVSKSASRSRDRRIPRRRAERTAANSLATRRTPAARHDYNFAVARVIGAIQRARLDAWTQPLRVPAADGGFVLTCKRNPDPQRSPALYDLMPADELRVKGAYVRDRERKEGIGAPLVAIERDVNNHSQRDHTMPRIYYGVTAVIRFEGRRAVLAFEDPLVTERVTLAEHQFPLAADFTAPIAVLIAQQNPRKLELESLLQPEKYAGIAHVTRVQPYDPNKMVVLIIHGLKDSPATWVPMFNHLIADEQIGTATNFGPIATRRVIPIHTPPRFCGASSMRSKAVFRCARRWSSSATAWAAASAGCSSPTRATSSGARFSKSRRRNRDAAREQGTAHANVDLSSPTGNRPRDLHRRAAPRKRPGTQLDWAHRLQLVKVPRNLLRVGQRCASPRRLSAR
jgi:hypothetical protein